MSISFPPFPELQSARLQLRQLSAADTPQIFALRSNPKIGQYLNRALHQQPSESLQFIHFINQGIAKKEWLYWGLCLTGDTTTLVGTVCLWNFSDDYRRAEIGYELHPDHQGKGLMREAVQRIIDYGFEQLNLNHIDAYTHHNNLASTRLLQACGFSLAKNIIAPDNPTDVIFTLTPQK